MPQSHRRSFTNEKTFGRVTDLIVNLGYRDSSPILREKIALRTITSPGRRVDPSPSLSVLDGDEDLD